MIATEAFLVPRELEAGRKAALALGLADRAALEVGRVLLDPGRPVDLELSVPFLPAMDEVVADAAQLRLAPASRRLEVLPKVSATPGGGVFVELEVPGRLVKLVLDGASLGPEDRVVVRSAERRGGRLHAGPPVFADPPLDAPSGMFRPPLEGLDVSRSGDRAVVTLPAPRGDAWVLQYSAPKKKDDDGLSRLEPLAAAPRSVTATVDATPSDVRLELVGDGEPVALWQHPGALDPEAGEQVADFTALAGRQLAAAYAAGGTATLALALRLTAATAGALAVLGRTLAVRYLARPAGAVAGPLRLGGGWVDLPLDAPAGRRPARTELRLRARHLGRELNGGGPPPLSPATAGLRVGAGRLVAAPVACEPLPDGSPPRLVAARVLAAVAATAEVVCELRADAAGAPGRPLGPPAVLRADAGPPGWLELPLPEPGVEVTAPATLWAVLRTNEGELLWLAGAGPAARASADGGASWGAVETGLVAAESPLVQLLHQVPAPPAAARLALRLGELDAGTLDLAADPATGELVGPAGGELPAPVVAALAATAGTGRATTLLRLFSGDVLDLTVERLECAYDPFGR